MTRTELSQCLTDIPTKYLTAQERDYMLAKILQIPAEVATDNVIGGYMQFYHRENRPIWLGWEEVGRCIQEYAIQWRREGKNYIAYSGTLEGFPYEDLMTAMKSYIIRQEFGDVCHIEHVPGWDLRVSNYYDDKVLQLRTAEIQKG